MRLLVIFFDGLGDRPAPELDGRTPLEAAHTPNLDRLAAEGINGTLHARSPGYVLGSPLALHLLFGYPEETFPDRGPLIATARGVAIEADDVVLAARFASVFPEDGLLRLRQRFIWGREDICRAAASAIAEREIEGLRFRYTYGGRGDGLLVISNGASHEVTDTDPLGMDLPVLASRPRDPSVDPARADRTAQALNRYLAWAHARLVEVIGPADESDEPVNFLITKWSGPKAVYEPFRERWGMRPASLPDEEVVAGLVREMGFDIEQVDDREPEDDLRRRLLGARELLEQGYEFVHLHTKYPDPMSHENDPRKCRDAIEALDRAMGSYWEQLAADPDLVTVLTTDHTTPSVWAAWPRGQFFDLHGGEPGPIAIRGGNVRVDGVAEFGERAATGGGLGHLRGDDFMPVLLTASERANMYEMRPMPKHRLYRPRIDDVVPFDVTAFD